jgi:ribosome-associated protein
LRSTLDKRTSAPEDRAPGSDASGDVAGAGGDHEAVERPSRSARKRHAEALQKLGVGLSRMRPAKLRELQQHLTLPEALFEAILELHRLRSGPALARQRQYIGRLMRDVDPLPIERALAEFSRSGDAKITR